MVASNVHWFTHRVTTVRTGLAGKPCANTASNPSQVEARINAQLVTIIILSEFME